MKTLQNEYNFITNFLLKRRFLFKYKKIFVFAVKSKNNETSIYKSLHRTPENRNILWFDVRGPLTNLSPIFMHFTDRFKRRRLVVLEGKYATFFIYYKDSKHLKMMVENIKNNYTERFKSPTLVYSDENFSDINEIYNVVSNKDAIIKKEINEIVSKYKDIVAAIKRAESAVVNYKKQLASFRHNIDSLAAELSDEERLKLELTLLDDLNYE